MHFEKLSPDQLRAHEFGITENQMEWMGKHPDWIAGFTYGEGWMGFVDPGERRYEYPIVLFSSTDLERMENIQERIGGTLSPRNSPPGGRLKLGPELTAWVASLIEPYALSRKPLVEQMLEWKAMTDRSDRVGFIATQTSSKNDRLALADSYDYADAVSNDAFVGGYIDAKARLTTERGIQVLRISSTDHHILRALHERYGGGFILEVEGAKLENSDTYRWRLDGAQVYEFLDKIRGHTFLTRDKIDQILRYSLNERTQPSLYLQNVREHIRLSPKGLGSYQSKRISEFLEQNGDAIHQAFAHILDEAPGGDHISPKSVSELPAAFTDIVSRLLQGSDRAYIQGGVDTSPVVDNTLLAEILDIAAREFRTGITRGIDVRMLGMLMPYHSIDFISEFYSRFRGTRFLRDGTLLHFARKNPRNPVEAVENYLRICEEVLHVANSSGFPYLSDGGVVMFARPNVDLSSALIHKKLVEWQELQKKYPWMPSASVWTAVATYADSKEGIKAMINRISIEFPISFDSEGSSSGATLHRLVKDTSTPEPETEVIETERSEEASLRIQRLFNHVGLSGDDRSFLVEFILAQNDLADQERLASDAKMTWEEISERGKRLLKHVQGFI
jgi:hypothetical protein